MPRGKITTIARLGVAMALFCLALFAAAPASAVILPPGFQQSKAIGGLERPMDIEIAADGRVFVAEKSGIVKTYSSLSDTSATTFADLRTQVHNYSNRGLLGLAVDPGFPAKPYVYVYYTLDAPVGGTAPVFGTAGTDEDSCPGSLDEVNCVVSARVSRLAYRNERIDGPEQVLVNDWCQQFQYHAGGGLEFGADGYLYVSSGDGGRWGTWDYGQLGNPVNPCGDPPSPVGGPMTPPSAEGGRLRAQDLRTSGDPLGLGGSLIRIDPATGAGAPGNPRATSADANERRMLAHGFRNAPRLAIRPGTNDVWVGDWGGGYWEEINRVAQPADAIRNFGWPCYEGGLDEDGMPYARVRPRSDDQQLAICEDLYLEGNATTAPYFAYDHEREIVDGENCSIDESANEPGGKIWGISFYPSAGNFPAAYRGALFFGDELRECIWAMLPGADGLPQRNRVIPFAQDAASPLDIEVAPSGDLLWIDDAAHDVKRIRFTGNAANHAPTAVAGADHVTGSRPMTVTFDSGGSTDPDPGDLLTHEWDLDGDGQFDDSTAVQPQHTFLQGGTYTVALRVTDTSGATDTDTLTITVTSGPVASIDTPTRRNEMEDRRHDRLLRHGQRRRGRHAAGGGPGLERRAGRLRGTGELRRASARNVREPAERLGVGAGPARTRSDRDPADRHRLRRGDAHRLGAAGPAGCEPDSDLESRRRGADPERRARHHAGHEAGRRRLAEHPDGSDPADVRQRHPPVLVVVRRAAARTDLRHAGVGDRLPRRARPDLSGHARAGLRRRGRCPRRADATGLQLRHVEHAPHGPGDRTRGGHGHLHAVRGRWARPGVSRARSCACARPRTRSTASRSTRRPVGGRRRASTGATGPHPRPRRSPQVNSIDAQQWVEWDVTPAVTGDGPVDLRLTPTGDDGVTFHSREAVQSDAAPAARRDRRQRRLRATEGGRRDAAVPRPRLQGVHQPQPDTRPCRSDNPSCSPPAQASSELTVGTSDANGATSELRGHRDLQGHARRTVDAGRRGRRAAAGLDH